MMRALWGVGSPDAVQDRCDSLSPESGLSACPVAGADESACSAALESVALASSPLLGVSRSLHLLNQREGTTVD